MGVREGTKINIRIFPITGLYEKLHQRKYPAIQYIIMYIRPIRDCYTQEQPHLHQSDVSWHSVAQGDVDCITGDQVACQHLHHHTLTDTVWRVQKETSE